MSRLLTKVAETSRSAGFPSRPSARAGASVPRHPWKRNTLQLEHASDGSTWL